MKKKGGAMNKKTRRQMTNCLACGALGCASAHLLGASAATACATGTSTALGSAKARQAIDSVFGNTKVVVPSRYEHEVKSFKTKIEYYKSLTTLERIEMFSLMTPEYVDYIMKYNRPEYLALIDLPKTYVGTDIPIKPYESWKLSKLLDKARIFIDDPNVQKFEWRVCPCENKSCKCLESMTSGDSALRFVPINGKNRNPKTLAGWGYPYGTNNENNIYYVPEEHILENSITAYNIKQASEFSAPGMLSGGNYFNKKKFSKKNRIRKKKKSKKN